MAQRTHRPGGRALALRLESAHALAGAMKQHKAATKGILVTTSWFGQRSREFAADNRIELIDGRALKALLLEHLGLDVLIGLDRVPKDWDRQDIT